ncbi:MAG: hypothetical protein LM590_06100 [Thermofilum sp.]|nr:hypothetical protein [Thermofilum sp.]
MRSTILPALLAVLLASLPSFAVATYIYYPWPEKLVIHSSLVALSFIIAVQKPGRQSRILFHFPAAATKLALTVGFVALIATSIVPIPSLALPLALVHATLVTGVSLAEALKLRGIFADALGFALFSFIFGSTYFGVIVLSASLFLGFPANRYVGLALVALHTFHLVTIYSKEARSQPVEIMIKVDQLFFVCTWIIFTYNFFSIYYPGNVYQPGLDLLRHYMSSVNLIRNLWKFLSLNPDNYLIFHAFEGGLMLLANCYDALLFNSFLIPVGLLSALALAQLAGEIAGSPTVRNIALMLPFVFSGLGWLYLLLNRPANPAAYFSALVNGNEKLYRNLMYIPFNLMWPVPHTFSDTSFLLFLSLLLRTVKLQGKLPKAAAVAGLLMFSMLSTHPPQGIVAAALLALLALFWGRSLSSALKPISLGAFAGAFAGGVLNVVTNLLALRGAPYLQSLMLLRAAAFFAPALAAAAALVLSSFGVGLEPLFAGLVRRLRVRAPIASALGTFLLILGISVALDPSNTFATSRADPEGVVGLVPWFMYAILLGVALPLGLRSYELLAREGAKISVAVLASLAVLAVAVGRTLGFLNAFGIDTGYWGEKRFVLFVYIALVSPAAYALERFARGSQLRAVALSFLLALLAINATICASYWGILSERQRINVAEKVTFDKLGELLWVNPSRWVLSPTLRSRDASAFAAPIYYVFFANPFYIWRWQVPELSLAIFRARNLDPPYLYINWATDSQPARSGWIGRALLPRLPKLFSEGSIDVYDTPLLAPPLPNGGVALVIPPVWDESVDEAYLSLSLAGVNFTSVLEIDPALYSYRVIVVPYDPLEETRTVTVDLLRAPIALTSGAVRINADSIELGGRPERLGNVVVWRNPFYLLPEAFNVTTRFEVGEYNPKVLNYFFVYDFRDVGNYKYVGVMFTERNQVYVLNCSIASGNASCSPAWPGILIGNISNVAGEHVLNVYSDVAKEELCITLDAFKRACFATSFSGGSIGIRADSFWALKVKEVFLTARTRSYLHLERLKAENHTIIVLQHKNDDSKIKYGRSIIVYTKEILGGKYIYINSTFIPEKYYSEINYANLGTSDIAFYNLSVIALNLLVVPFDSLRIYKFNKIYNVASAKYLTVESSLDNFLKAFCEHAYVKGGIGFYVRLEADKMHVPNARVRVYFNNDAIIELEGDLLFEGRFLLLARRPIFMAQRSVINGVYWQALRYPYLVRDLVVIGNVTFSFICGDSSFSSFFVNARSSKIMFEPQLDIYSDWESMPLVLKYSYWSILIACIFALMTLRSSVKKRELWLKCAKAKSRAARCFTIYYVNGSSRRV